MQGNLLMNILFQYTSSNFKVLSDCHELVAIYNKTIFPKPTPHQIRPNAFSVILYKSTITCITKADMRFQKYVK